jgi:hypothetical protein
MVQELQNMQFKYIQSQPEHKAALRSVILHRAADYPEEAMPYELSKFIHELRNSIPVHHMPVEVTPPTPSK